MKKIFFLTAIILIAMETGITAQNNSQSTSAPKFDPARDPFVDLKESIIEAQKTNKRILLDVGGEWCIWCHRLDGFLDSNPELKNFMHDNYIVLKINFSQENKNEKFLSQYPKISGYPHIFILGTDGKFLYSKNTGELEKEKSYDADKIMSFLKEWIPVKNSK